MLVLVPTVRYWALVALLLLFAAAPAPATEPCGSLPAGGGPAKLAPPASPTVLSVGFEILELTDVDIVRGRFSFESWVVFQWCDPRLAFDPAQGEAPERILRGEAALLHMDTSWQPDLNTTNGTVEVTKRILRIARDGTVRLEGLFNADLSAAYDLRRFPLDYQILPIRVESFTWNADHIVFRPIEGRITISDAITLAEWDVTGIGARVEAVAAARDVTPFSRITIDVRIDREYGFYVLKVAVPLAIIVMLSWAIFWMTEESFASRTRASSTGVLTVVAYQFAIASSLPKVPYLTLLDKLMVVSFTLIASTVAQSFVVSRAAARNPAHGQRIDAISRWLFPLVYVVAIAVVLVTRPE